MFVIPVRTEVVRHVADDPPVGPTPFERFEDLVEALDSPLGAGEGPLLLQAGGGGKYDIRVATGVAEEDVLDHEEIELGEGVLDVVRVRVDQAHFFTK